MNAMRGEDTKINIYDDVWITPQANDMICPRIVYDSDLLEEGATKSYTIPFSTRGVHATNSTTATGIGFSFHNVEVRGDKISTKIALLMMRPEYLVLPDNVDLVQYSIFNGTSGYDTGSFKNGALIFGKRVYGCHSGWINRTTNVFKLKVYFPDGFHLRENQTLYLSKLPTISQECLQKMVQNLYDYAGNGDTTTRTINLGSAHLALLTTEEINTANRKGWYLT